MIRDEMLDLALFILILAVAISVGLGTAYNEMRNVKDFSNTVIEDKNISAVVGENIAAEGSYDGTMSRAEVILTTQVQDFGMPTPKTFRAKSGGTDTDINITSTYEEDLISYGQSMWNLIKNDNASQRYTIDYQMEDSSNDTEAYRINRGS